MKLKLAYIWVMLQMFFLVIIEYNLYYYNNEKDIDLVFGIVEIYLNFPSSIIVSFTGSIFSQATSINQYYDELYVKMIFIFISWFFFVLFGYIQWFIVFPFIVRKIKSKWSKE